MVPEIGFCIKTEVLNVRKCTTRPSCRLLRITVTLLICMLHDEGI